MKKSWVLMFILASVLFSSNLRSDSIKKESLLIKSKEFASVQLGGGKIQTEKLWENKMVKGGSFYIDAFNTVRIILDGVAECKEIKAWSNDGLKLIGEESFTQEICVDESVRDGMIQPTGPSLRVTVPTNIKVRVAHIDSNFFGRIPISIVDNPKITLTKNSSTTTPLAGENVSFTINIENTGEFIMRHTELNYVLDPNLTYVNASIENTLTNNGYVFQIPDIEPNESFNITLIAKVKNEVPENTKIENSIKVVAEYAEEKSLTQTLNVAAPTQNVKPSFTLSNTPSKTKVRQGEAFNYMIKVKNTSTTNASDVSIRSTIPTHLEVLDPASATNHNGVLSWTTNINAGETKNYNVKVKMKENVDIGTLINNTTSIFYENKELQSVTNQIEIQPTKIDIELTSDKTTIHGGEQITYTIKVQNNNDIIAKNIIVTQKFDENLILENAEGGKIENNIVTYEIKELEPNSEKVYIVKAKLKEEIEETGTLNNKTEVNEDGIKNNIINENQVVITKDLIKTNDIENPKTGAKLIISIVLLGLLALAFIKYKVKKMTIFYKI